MEKRVSAQALANYDLSKLQGSLEEAEEMESREMGRDPGGYSGPPLGIPSQDYSTLSTGGISSAVLYDGLNPVQIVVQQDDSEEEVLEDATMGSRGDESDDGGAFDTHQAHLQTGLDRDLPIREFYTLDRAGSEQSAVTINPEALRGYSTQEQLELIQDLLSSIGHHVGFSVRRSDRSFTIEPLQKAETSRESPESPPTEDIYEDYTARLKRGFRLKRKGGKGLLVITQESFNLGSIPQEKLMQDNPRSPNEILRRALALRGVDRYIDSIVDW
ncbi:phosphoprotein [Tupavirus incomtus]|uniref:Phosphoprotein n=1 Tax=Tupavirus sp. TaxID=2809944 RepID=A0AAE9ZZ62_9RHAB|nr:phosphoprotein [Tupavirus sp.]